MAIEEQYKAYQQKKYKKIIAVFLLVVLAACSCLTLGTDLSLVEGLIASLNFAIGNPLTGESITAQKVLIYLRLPRICIAILSGMGLAIAGMMMQSVTRNFLVSPFTLGVSSAAAFGASMCIVFGNATIFFNDFLIIGSAFAMAVLGMLVIYIVTKSVGITANSVILVGIALNYFFAALTASLQFFAQENKLAAVVQWSFGTFNRANWHAVMVIGVVVIACLILSRRLLLQWDVIASGNDELVKSLGINPEKLRSKTMLLAVLLTATIISFTGVIGFVGLIAPHIARFTVGNEHNFLFPMTAAVGSILLVLADTLGKYILYPVNVPVGIVVSFIGVPIFIHLIISTRRGGV